MVDLWNVHVDIMGAQRTTEEKRVVHRRGEEQLWGGSYTLVLVLRSNVFLLQQHAAG